MPRKIRELIKDLEKADRGGKGSHRNFIHPKAAKTVVLSGNRGADAQHYQEKAVRVALEEVQNE